MVGNGRLADAGLDLLNGDLLFRQILFHQDVVQLCHMLHHFGPVLLGFLQHVRRDVLAADVLAQIVIIDIGLHFHQVNDALEGFLSPNGKLDGHRVAL